MRSSTSSNRAMPDGQSVPSAKAQPMLLSEIIGALSYALDLTEGQPAGHCVRCCWIGIHVGRQLGLDENQLWDLYYTLLLKDAGCSSNAARLCELYGHDDVATKRDFKAVDSQKLVVVARFVLSHTGLGQGLRERFKRILNLALHGESLADELVKTRCERGVNIARQLGFNEAVADGIRCLDEHWNGKGRPHHLIGQAIPLAARIALVAQVADVFHQIGGRQRALDELLRRRGVWFDPAVVDALEMASNTPAFWKTLRADNLEAAVRDLEPQSGTISLDEDRLDAIAVAFAQVVDAKSPYTFGHSTRVAHYADAIAKQMALSPKRRRWLHRGALLHDIGKLGVSNSILDKPGRLTQEEWEEVKAHPRYTEEILARIGPFTELARMAAAHHERLDGKGYPKGLKHDEISLETRILTVSDIFDSLTDERPYRRSLSTTEALTIMSDEFDGAIDSGCFGALKHCIKSE